MASAAILMGLAACGAPAAHAAPPKLQVRDDLGRLVTLAHPAQRLVVLQPSAFEIADALGLRKDIVGAAYVRRSPPHELLVKPLPGAGAQTLAGGLHEVALVPTGCLLVRASVFHDLQRPWFESPSVRSPEQLPEALRDYVAPYALPAIIGEDTWFCATARAAGFKVWLDVDLTRDIGHIGEHTFTVQTHDTEEAARAAPANERNAS